MGMQDYHAGQVVLWNSHLLSTRLCAYLLQVGMPLQLLPLLACALSGCYHNSSSWHLLRELVIVCIDMWSLCRYQDRVSGTIWPNWTTWHRPFVCYKAPRDRCVAYADTDTDAILHRLFSEAKYHSRRHRCEWHMQAFAPTTDQQSLISIAGVQKRGVYNIRCIKMSILPESE
jgi:hypothetical protein